MATEAAVERTVQGLDPIARGVLDLSLRHDFSDTSIAQVVGRSDHDVATLREQTMAQVAAELGLEGDDAYERTREELLTVPAEVWIGMPAAPAAAEPDADAEPPEAAAEPEPRASAPAPPAAPRAEGQRSNGLVLLGLALAAALVVVLFLSRSGGDEPTAEPVPQAQAPEAAPGDPQPPEPAPEPPPDDAIVLEPLPGVSTGGTVTVSVSDEGVARVDLDGLREPAGVYKLWLFTSLISSQALGSTSSGNGVITAQLPEDAASYAFLDLSLERSPGDRLHSGRSVMRIATASVLDPPD